LKVSIIKGINHETLSLGWKVKGKNFNHLSNEEIFHFSFFILGKKFHDWYPVFKVRGTLSVDHSSDSVAQESANRYTASCRATSRLHVSYGDGVHVGERRNGCRTSLRAAGHVETFVDKYAYKCCVVVSSHLVSYFFYLLLSLNSCWGNWTCENDGAETTDAHREREGDEKHHATWKRPQVVGEFPSLNRPLRFLRTSETQPRGSRDLVGSREVVRIASSKSEFSERKFVPRKRIWTTFEKMTYGRGLKINVPYMR